MNCAGIRHLPACLLAVVRNDLRLYMSSEQPQPTEVKGPQREKDVYDLIAWLENNKKTVISVALLLVAVGFAIATMRYLRDQKEVRASGDLLALKAALTVPTNTAPVQANALAKVAQEHSGTAAAERARFLAATALFTEGKFAEAETAFKNFLGEFANSEWRAAAAYGVATAQEAQNKPEAQASYQQVTTAYAKSSVADDAKLALARMHEAKNQPADALRIYNELTAPKPGAQPGEPPNQVATERKEALLRKHPELNTNAPAANASAPMLQPSLQLPGGGQGLQITPGPTTPAPQNTTPAPSAPADATKSAPAPNN
ncbi:MAG TPA: tetratricopeptide repeat protein [Verrucomicrobiae bacterium]